MNDVDLPPIRCCMLGHEVPLSYCYQVASGGPCRRLFECWEPVIPGLRSVVAQLMTQEEWRTCFETPTPSKMDTLLNLIDHAKDRLQVRSKASVTTAGENRRTNRKTPAVDAVRDDIDYTKSV